MLLSLLFSSAMATEPTITTTVVMPDRTTTCIVTTVIGPKGKLLSTTRACVTTDPTNPAVSPTVTVTNQ